MKDLRMLNHMGESENGSDSEILEKLISRGYNIVGRIFKIDEIQSNYNLSDIDSFIKVFSLEVIKKELLDPKNSDKFIIILRKPPDKQAVIITSDSECIELARKQLAIQNEPTKLEINIRCSVFGGSSEYEQIVHVDRMVSELDGFLDWKFEQLDAGIFRAHKVIGSLDENEARKEIDVFRQLLDYIAIKRKIGIRIQNISIKRISKHRASVSVGPQEFRPPPLTKEEINGFEKFRSLDPEILKIAKGLNQSYLLWSPNIRLALLWAVIDGIFSGKPDRLLSEDEIRSILQCTKSIGIDREKLKRLKDILSNPNILPSKSRNKRISENIAKSLELDPNNVYEIIKHASKIRAAFLHEFEDNSEILKVERDLRQYLEKYLEENLKNSEDR